MPAHGQKSSVSRRLYDARNSTWCSPDLFYNRYPHMRPGAPVPQVPAPGPCPIQAPPMAPTTAWESPEAKREAYAVAYGAPGKIETPDPVAAAEEALREAKQQAKENAAAERAALAAKEAEQAEADRREALRQRIEYESGLASTTKQLLADIAALLLRNVRHIGPGTYYAEYATELQPLAKTYGCKIIPVGDRTLGTVVVLP